MRNMALLTLAVAIGTVTPRLGATSEPGGQAPLVTPRGSLRGDE